MDYLHEPYLFYYLSRYNNKLKLMKKAPRKVYVVDNGFVASKAFVLSDNLVSPDEIRTLEIFNMALSQNVCFPRNISRY